MARLPSRTIRAGTWFVELDDGTGAEYKTELDGNARLHAGETLPGTVHGRRWRIVRVDADTKHAVAVPDD